MPRLEWATTSAAQVMLPLDELQRIYSDTELWAVLQKMDRDGVNQLPVTRDHHVIGMLAGSMSSTFLRTLQELERHLSPDRTIQETDQMPTSTGTKKNGHVLLLAPTRETRFAGFAVGPV